MTANGPVEQIRKKVAKSSGISYKVISKDTRSYGYDVLVPEEKLNGFERIVTGSRQEWNGQRWQHCI